MTGANKSEFDEARFARLVESYGADPARWPENLRQAALRFLSSSTAAQNWRADARELDLALASATSPPAPAELETAILAGFDRVAKRWSLRKSIGALAHIVWPGAPLWQPAAVFGLSLAVGIAVAILAPLDLHPVDDASASVFALDSVADSDPSQDI